MFPGLLMERDVSPPPRVKRATPKNTKKAPAARDRGPSSAPLPAKGPRPPLAVRSVLWLPRLAATFAKRTASVLLSPVLWPLKVLMSPFLWIRRVFRRNKGVQEADIMGADENRKADGNSKSEMSFMLPIMISAIALPLSLFMWIGNMAWSFLMSSAESVNSEDVVIPPTRWFMSIVTPLIITVWGLKKKSLSRSGAALGIIVGFVLTLSNYAFLACLFTFFFTSSKATKFRSESKRKFEEDFKEGGQRNWIQVLCNGGMAVQLGILYLIDAGCGERPIDFVKDYRASWLGVGILGVFSACNGDTWASELGSVIGSSEPVLITSGKKVPRGTNGGVTLWGVFLSFLGGLAVGVSYYLAVLYAIDASMLAVCPPQWPLLVFGGLAGFFGSLLDSVLGATLQFSGYDKEKGCVVEKNRKGVKHISGIHLLDNHSVNLISSVAMGLLTPKLAYALWP